MGLKYHTVIFVPHSRAKFRKWRVSNRQLRITAALITVLTLSVSFLVYSHLTASVDLDELSKLRQENSRLRAVYDEFETSYQDLERRLADYEDQTSSLAIIAGLGSVPQREGSGAVSGAGGDLIAPSGWPSPSQLNQRTSRLDNLLETVEGRLMERERWIAASPSVSPVRGVLTSRYGDRKDPITQRPAFHKGIDISADAGKPVRTSADGVVVRASRIGEYGRAVQISHGYGVTTLYGHLQQIEVKPGDRVTRGDTIGTVGNTGRATGYHLHYEVRVDNRSQDPLHYMLDR
jgi:murein DD-endopeptidase MepM/ murein hydrolase activator NlpD